MHNVLGDLENLLVCYAEDHLERSRYKQTYEDGDAIHKHMHDVMDQIDRMNESLLVRLKGAQQHRAEPK
jgi:hypothetical protein